jgi:hypothetical protein
MSPRLRKVTVLEHLGSAHTEAELAALLAAGEEKLDDYGVAEQLELELGLPTDAAVGSELSYNE